MAPEAALGEAVDGRTDLYALGCVAYYLLTGTTVFEGSSPIALVAKHLEERPVPPSRRTEMVIPPELERLVLICLEKNPEDRPQTAADVARTLAAMPVPSEWTEEHAAQWWRVNAPSRPELMPV
jgi:serine/threonine-protein kinase